MKRLIFTGLMLLVGCEGNPGEVSVSLQLASGVNSAQIQRFLFVVKDPTSADAPSLLFPQSCTGCTTAASPCPTAEVCIELNACGYEVNQSGFQARVDFADFAKQSNAQLIACATNGVDTIVASGASVFENTGGKSATVVLSTTDTSCNILPVCP